MSMIIAFWILFAFTLVFIWRYVDAMIRLAKKTQECESSHIAEEQARASFNSLLSDNIAMSRQLVKLTGILAERAGIDIAEDPKPGLDESHPMSVAQADRVAAEARRQAMLRDQGFTPAKVDDGTIKPRVDQVEDPEAIKMYDTPYHVQDEEEDPWPKDEEVEAT